MNELLSIDSLYKISYGIAVGMLFAIFILNVLFGFYYFIRRKIFSARTFLYHGLATIFCILFHIYLIYAFNIAAFGEVTFASIPDWLLMLAKLSVPILVFFNYRTFINTLPVRSLEDYKALIKAQNTFKLFNVAIVLSILCLILTDNYNTVLIISLKVALLETFLTTSVMKAFEKRDLIKQVLNAVLVVMTIVGTMLVMFVTFYGLAKLTNVEIIVFQIFFAFVMVTYSFVLIQNSFRNKVLNENTSELLSDGFFKNIYYALRDDEFFLLYQPKVSLRTGKICGVEALLRWNHPKKGLIPPNDFLINAEKTAVINNICEWVINKAIEDVQKLREQGIYIPIAINFSVRNITPKMIAFLLKALQDNNLPSSCIIVEVTESLFLDINEQLLKAIEDIKKANIRLSLDDFGAGYSSVRHLDKLPLSEVKIDCSLIDNMNNKKQKAVVSTLLTMCHILDLEVVAEGINEVKTKEYLLNMNCEMGQGYGICRPKRLESLIDWAMSNLADN